MSWISGDFNVYCRIWDAFTNAKLSKVVKMLKDAFESTLIGFKCPDSERPQEGLSRNKDKLFKDLRDRMAINSELKVSKNGRYY